MRRARLALGAAIALLFPALRPVGADAGRGGEDVVQADAPVIFSVTGDIPYSPSEITQFQRQIDEHDLYSPSEFLNHVGDIKSGSDVCSEDRYTIVRDILESSQVPCYIEPGDNETTDCTSLASAWAYWNAHLLRLEQNWACSPVTERQSGRAENFAFVHKGMLFLGINLVSGSNDIAVMQDDAAWVTQQLQSKGSQVRGGVIFAQAGPGSNHSTFFNPFVAAAANFAKPILYIHGDGHSWIQDRPFSATNILRVQVEDGSSELPVQVTATLDSQDMFQFKRDPWSQSSIPIVRPPCGASGPMLAISDAIVTEGDFGTVTMNFGVTLANSNGQSVSVQYATAGGTAIAGTDYVSTSGSLSFSGATTSRTVAVTVNGDFDIEPDENFYVDLRNPINAAISDARGKGTIQTDDGNRAPLARSDDFTVTEDVQLTVSAPGVLGNDSDPDGDALIASLQSGTTFGSLSLSPNGGFTYAPNPNFSGSDEFTYIASDGHGGRTTATVTLGLTPVNDTPAASNDSYATPVAATLVISSPGVLANDTDVDGDVLSAELLTWPQYGSLALSANGSFSYRPVGDFDGVDSFTYRVRDAVSSGGAATVTISVGGPASATILPSTDAYVNAGKPRNNYGTASELRVRGGSKAERSYLRFTVTNFPVVRSARLRLYVTDGSSNGGSAYAVANTYAGTTTPWTETGITWTNAPTIPGSPLATLGTVSTGQWIEIDLTAGIPTNGTYCLALATTVTDLARYTSREGTNKPQLLIERGNVSGIPANQAPVLGADGYATSENIVLTVAAPGVLGNDSDPDGDPMALSLASPPAHGMLSLQPDGGFTYTPAPNYSGSDSFAYTLSDGRGGFTTGSVALAVNPVNDAPVAAADAWSVARDGVLTVAAPGVLANDSDPEGDPLTAVLVAAPSHGSFALSSDGSLTYAPGAGYSGPDTLTYQASDGIDQSPVTTVALNVEARTVTFVEIETGASTASASIATAAPLGGSSGDLYVAAIASKSLRSVTSVSGLGLSWSRVRAQCSGRSQTMVEIWSARGVSVAGTVTATLSSSSENAVIAVARYSGADATNPFGNIVSGNSNGLSGLCSNGVDNAAFSFPLATEGGVVFGATAERKYSLTPGSGWSQRADVRAGTSGATASVTVVERPSEAGTTTFDGTMSTSVDWAAAAVEIRPTGAAARAIAAGGDSETEPVTQTAVRLERVFPNPTKERASIAYELSSPTTVELAVYNVRGQRVRALHQGSEPAGRHLLLWDTRDLAGQPVPAGIYFVRMKLGERIVHQKLVVQR
jgi:hypothetical protein